MNTTEQIKELRRLLRNTIARSRYLAAKPPPKNAVFAAAAKAWLPTAFDIRPREIILAGVDGKHLSLATLGRCYGISRQRAFQLAQQFGREKLAYPAELREVLQRGPHNLSDRLDKPGECERIQAEITNLTKQPATRKSPSKATL
jgi:hypothetical protein